MKDIFFSLSLSKKIFLRDKVCFILGLLPVGIGLILYYWVGKWFYGPVLEWGNNLVSQFITKDSLNSIIYYLFFGLISIFLFVLIGYTFTLVVSLVASPFNDLLSSRVEKILLGKKTEGLKESLLQTMRKMLVILKEELKKIFVILLLTLMAFFIGLFPVLAPISFFISATCLAIQFLDYTWCRREMAFRQCFRSLNKSLFSYSVTGVFFSLLMMVPVLNLVSIPFAVTFYTVLWLVKNEKSQITYDLA
jgi:CysZ protein